jgi:hypothetical protein
VASCSGWIVSVDDKKLDKAIVNGSLASRFILMEDVKRLWRKYAFSRSCLPSAACQRIWGKMHGTKCCISVS